MGWGLSQTERTRNKAAEKLHTKPTSEDGIRQLFREWKQQAASGEDITLFLDRSEKALSLPNTDLSDEDRFLRVAKKNPISRANLAFFAIFRHPENIQILRQALDEGKAAVAAEKAKKEGK